MSSQSPKTQAIRYWWSRAAESLNAARRELAAGDHALAVNRAYYALFYAVSALLLEEGHKFKKHSGVRAAFNREIIKAGRLPRHHGQLYNRLFRDRLKGDYVSFAEFDKAYVEKQIQGCEAFLRDIGPMLKSLRSKGKEGKPHAQH
ncbi:MAG: HEPN domain-containing protein [Candidatus Methylomirabilia bacterium]